VAVRGDQNKKTSPSQPQFTFRCQNVLSLDGRDKLGSAGARGSNQAHAHCTPLKLAKHIVQVVGLGVHAKGKKRWWQGWLVKFFFFPYTLMTKTRQKAYPKKTGSVAPRRSRRTRASISFSMLPSSGKEKEEEREKPKRLGESSLFKRVN
jgi:hypothetical protein